MSASLNRVVPLNRVCTLTGVARSSVYFVRRSDVCVVSTSTRADRWLSDDELVVHIRQVLAATPFLGEGYYKVGAKLRFGGIRTSPGRVMRLMREHNLRAPVNFGAPTGSQSHDGTIIPPAPDMRWDTGLTGTWTTQEGNVSVMLAVDDHTAEILGIHAAKRASRWEALGPIRQAVRRWRETWLLLIPLMANRFDQLMYRAGRHALHVCLLDHCRQRLLGGATRFEKRWRIAASAQLRNAGDPGGCAWHPFATMSG